MPDQGLPCLRRLQLLLRWVLKGFRSDIASRYNFLTFKRSMEGLPTKKTIKFKVLQLGQTLLSRPSFCNEKLLSKARIIKYSYNKTIISNFYINIFFPMQKNTDKEFYFNSLKIQQAFKSIISFP